MGQTEKLAALLAELYCHLNHVDSVRFAERLDLELLRCDDPLEELIQVREERDELERQRDELQEQLENQEENAGLVREQLLKMAEELADVREENRKLRRLVRVPEDPLLLEPRRYELLKGAMLDLFNLHVRPLR